MSRRGYANQPTRLRRFGAAVALLGLIFASAIASISHSIAMPMMAGAALQSVQQDSAQGKAQAGHHMAGMSHDCESAATAEAPQQQPQGPCDEGCMLCKDCTMTGFTLISPIGIGRAERYSPSAPATVRVPASMTPPSPNEPPRV
jgi:hypothetical protein